MEPRPVVDALVAVLQALPHAALMLDHELRILAANVDFYKTCGIQPESVRGRRFFEIEGGEWATPHLRNRLTGLRSSDDPVSFEAAFPNAARQPVPCRACAIEEGGLYVLVTVDDDAGQQLLRSRDQLRLLIKHAMEYAFFVMDAGGWIAEWNEGAERILGWREDEAVGHTGGVIFPPEDRQRGVFEAKMHEAAVHGSTETECWHVRKDGSRFWGFGTLVALRDETGDLYGFAKILRDNTRRKEAYDALRELNESLEERVEKRTRQVRRLASRLTMAEQAERRRISLVLHDDLQQLLYGIQVRANLMYQDALAFGQQELVESAEKIDTWISEAVELTRGLAVDLSPPVLQEEVFGEALRWLGQRMALQFGLEVVVQDRMGGTVPRDDMRILLFQVIRELLFNVVKHAEARRAVVTLDEQEGYLVIEVMDDGKGIDIVERRARGGEGSGFGISSIQERLALFGGALTFASAPDEGTWVTIHIPQESLY